MERNDTYYIKEAIKEAKKAYLLDEVPVGCVIVIGDKIVARGHNMKESKNNALMHAEMVAINKALKRLDTAILPEATIYVTLEPCLMCAGAIFQTRIKRVVYGASEPKFGVLGSVLSLQDVKGFNHKIDVSNGICKAEIEEMMKEFFRKLRNKDC
ncbi:MAG TPA: nucleoside deaminase [Bacilli bacterium]